MSGCLYTWIIEKLSLLNDGQVNLFDLNLFSRNEEEVMYRKHIFRRTNSKWRRLWACQSLLGANCPGLQRQILWPGKLFIIFFLSSELPFWFWGFLYLTNLSKFCRNAKLYLILPQAGAVLGHTWVFSLVGKMTPNEEWLI